VSEATDPVAEEKPLLLENEWNVKRIGELKSLLESVAANDEVIQIDGGDVENIDTAALQLLCAFIGHRRASGGQVEWVRTSSQLHEQAELLGMQEHLQLPDAPLQGSDEAPESEEDLCPVF